MSSDATVDSSNWLLEILGCPACDDRPALDQTDDGLRCSTCGRVYPVVDGLPILVADTEIGSPERGPEEGAAKR